MTLAQPYGPTSATASGAANVSWVSWEFTATPASGISSTQAADTPLVWWYNLKANTPCECSCGAMLKRVATCWRDARADGTARD